LAQKGDNMPASKRKSSKTKVVAKDEPAKSSSKLRKLRPRSPFRGYFVESWRELRKVHWPNRREAWKLTVAVIVFSVISAAFLAGLDYGFEQLAKVIFLR
jgi:preprotein translocase subunit SecE